MMRCCGVPVCLILLGVSGLFAQSAGPAAPSPKNYNLVVSSAPGWTDTHIDLRPGEVARIAATAAKGNCKAEGVGNASKDGLTLPASLPGVLIGKVGTDSPFLVGSSKELPVTTPGRLYLGMNSGASAACNGELSVTLAVVAGAQAADIKSKLATAATTWLSGQFGTRTGGSPTAASADTTSATTTTAESLTVSDAAFDSQLAKNLEGLPRRVNDEFKNQGDMVNFVVVGSQEKLQKALASANWHLADETKAGAVAGAISSVLQKQDYVRMPMSTLFLFDRPQDYGYEQAEAYAVVASRHHFRVWKAPFTVNGETAWIGAGTHDIGFEKDQRNGKVTHKIDPAVDGERSHIGSTLQSAGTVKVMSYYQPSNPVKEARNATGGSYHSDGRLLVIVLK